MASDNKNIFEYINDFSQIGQNALLQLRSRNPFINQKKFMMSRMDAFLRSTADIEIRNVKDLKKVKRYLLKAANIGSIAERIMDKENKKLQRSQGVDKDNLRRKGKPFFDKETEFSIRITRLSGKVDVYKRSQTRTTNTPEYGGRKNSTENEVLRDLKTSPKFLKQKEKNLSGSNQQKKPNLPLRF